jgi:hypothetical protein
MHYYKDLFDIKMDIANESRFLRDRKDLFTSDSPKAMRHDFLECDSSKSNDFKFCQNQKFGRPQLEKYNKI